MEFVIVRTTVDSETAGEKLAVAIVDAKLAACVQQIPIKSIYRWKGVVEHADECLLLAKTRLSLSEELCSFIKKEHSYDVPEIVVTPIISGSEDYLGWIREETEGEGNRT